MRRRASETSFGLSGRPRRSNSLGAIASSRSSALHRQRVDPFGQVLAGRLAKLLLRRDHVHHVVADLEDGAEALAEVRQRVDHDRLEAGRQRPDPTCRCHQRRGLVGDRAQVLVLAPGRVERRAGLCDLSLAEPSERRREQSADLGAERGSDLHGAREQEVSSDDRDEVAPSCIDARNLATDDRFVHHVVVVEGREVDEFDRDATLDRVRARPADRKRRPTRAQSRTNPLPTCDDEVRHDIVEEFVASHDGDAELLFEGGQVGLGDRESEEIRRSRHRCRLGEAARVWDPALDTARRGEWSSEQGPLPVE